jgi:hypothetical protein
MAIRDRRCAAASATNLAMTRHAATMCRAAHSPIFPMGGRQPGQPGGRDRLLTAPVGPPCCRAPPARRAVPGGTRHAGPQPGTPSSRGTVPRATGTGLVRTTRNHATTRPLTDDLAVEARP